MPFGLIQNGLGKTKLKQIKILLDSGASSTIVSKNVVRKLRKQETTGAEWTTAAGILKTKWKCKIDMLFPELSPTRTINTTVTVCDSSISSYYDMIVGRDLLNELGMDIKFSTNTVCWETAEIPMKSRDATPATSYFIQETEQLRTETDRLSATPKWLVSEYHKTDLREYSHRQTNLNTKQAELLETSLRKFETLFDGTLGKWTGSPFHIELKENMKPYHGRPYTVPQAYDQAFRKEVERLCKIGVLKRVNRSEWAAPTFLIPKKNNMIRFISDSEN